MATRDLGMATAYAYALSQGYTGTEQEFAEGLVASAEYAENAEASAIRAENAANTVATEFSTSTSYAVGDYCLYNGSLYRCTTAHSGAWNASHFTEVSVCSELTDIKTDLSELSSVEILVQGTALVINTDLINGNEVSY